MHVESSCRPSAINKTSGATGLMQVIPTRWGRPPQSYLLDPANNIDWGVRILREWHKYCKSPKIRNHGETIENCALRRYSGGHKNYSNLVLKYEILYMQLLGKQATIE
jgi:soluble lytic murein transglycosylase-like protein